MNPSPTAIGNVDRRQSTVHSLIIDTVSRGPLPTLSMNYRYSITDALANKCVIKINSRVLPAKPPSGGQREPDALPDTVSEKRRGFVSVDFITLRPPIRGRYYCPRAPRMPLYGKKAPILSRVVGGKIADLVREEN